MISKYVALAFVTVLLGFSVNLHQPKEAFAAGKKESPTKALACKRTYTYCINDCRNGTKLPLNSSASQIAQCDFECDGVFIRCSDKAMEFRGVPRKDGSAGGAILEP